MSKYAVKQSLLDNSGFGEMSASKSGCLIITSGKPGHIILVLINLGVSSSFQGTTFSLEERDVGLFQPPIITS